jgi:putative membrane protein
MTGFSQVTHISGPAAAWIFHLGENTDLRSASWSWDLNYTLPLALAFVLYVAGFLRMKFRLSSGRLRWTPFVMFLGGWGWLVIALNSPIHEIGEKLFWVHMAQHEILVLISAPLLVLSRPLAPMLWALPARWREAIGRALKLKVLNRSWILISAPVIAWLLHAIALWVWHAPLLFDATLHSEFIHALQHISFLGTALLFWWALLEGHRGRLNNGVAVLYVFTTAVHTSILGALLTLSSRPWYPSYAATAPTWGWSALQDQQFGGLIMWVPSGTLLTIVALALVARSLRSSEQRWAYSRTAAVLREAMDGVHEA